MFRPLRIAEVGTAILEGIRTDRGLFQRLNWQIDIKGLSPDEAAELHELLCSLRFGKVGSRLEVYFEGETDLEDLWRLSDGGDTENDEEHFIRGYELAMRVCGFRLKQCWGPLGRTPSHY